MARLGMGTVRYRYRHGVEVGMGMGMKVWLREAGMGNNCNSGGLTKGEVDGKAR
jgi:hypothetical protein